MILEGAEISPTTFPVRSVHGWDEIIINIDHVTGFDMLPTRRCRTAIAIQTTSPHSNG